MLTSYDDHQSWSTVCSCCNDLIELSYPESEDGYVCEECQDMLNDIENGVTVPTEEELAEMLELNLTA